MPGPVRDSYQHLDGWIVSTLPGCCWTPAGWGNLEECQRQRWATDTAFCAHQSWMNCADTLCGFYTNFNETPCRWSAVALICQDSRESRRQARIDDPRAGRLAMVRPRLLTKWSIISGLDQMKVMHIDEILLFEQSYPKPKIILIFWKWENDNSSYLKHSSFCIISQEQTLCWHQVRLCHPESPCVIFFSGRVTLYCFQLTSQERELIPLMRGLKIGCC